MNDEELAKLVVYLLQQPEIVMEKPEDLTGPWERYIRLGLMPRYRILVDRVKRDEMAPELMNMLWAYARYPVSTPGRTFARKVLSEAGKDDIH